MKLALLMFGLLFTQTAMANGNFAKGLNYKANNIQGQVSVYCPNTSRIINCYDSYLSPGSYSKFTYSGEQKVDKVELEAIYEDGKSRKKSSKMKKNVSKRNFNLWIGSLLQRPLFNYGENIVKYKFSNNGKEVESGELSVQVERTATRYCPWASYRGFNESDCNNTAAICSNYFRRYNDCQ